MMLAASLQAKSIQQVVLSSVHELVEDVEVPLPVVLMDNPWLL